MKYTLLAEKARYYKEGEEGVKVMCEIWEEAKEEGIEEGIVKIVNNTDMGIDKAA